MSMAETSRVLTTDDRGGGIAVAFSIVVASVAASRILGFVRQAAINAQFGVSPEADAWFTAFRIPDTIFMLLAGGALSSAVIPVYMDVKARGDPMALRQMLGGVATLVFLGSTAAAAAGALLAGPLMNAIAPGFSIATRDLAVEASRWLMVSPVILGLCAVAKAGLQSERRFVLPALGPLVYNVGIIFGAVVLARFFGLTGLVWGTLIGVGLYLGVQVPGVWIWLAPRPVIGLNNPDVRRVMILMLPRLLGVAVLQASLIYVNILASLQGESMVAAINNGFLLMLLPLGLFAMALGEATLPELARYWSVGDRTAFASRVTSVARHVMFLTIPAAVGLVVLAEPLVGVLFQRGMFDARATELTATALRFFAIGLVGHAAVEILVRGFFAMQDTRTPVAIGSLGLTMHMCLSWLFGQWFGLGGIALGLSIGVLVEASILSVILWRRGGLQMGEAEASSVAITSVAALIMGLVVVGLRMLTWSTGPIGVGSVVLLLGYVFAAVVFYCGVAALFRSRELGELCGRLSAITQSIGRRR